MRSHLLKFPTKPIKLHAVEIVLAVLTILDAFILKYYLYFNHSYTVCSLAQLPSCHLLQKRASRIGGPLKYVINY